MVALINYQVPVIGNNVVCLLIPHQALNDSDVYDPAGLSLASSDAANSRLRKIEKHPKARNPIGP